MHRDIIGSLEAYNLYLDKYHAASEPKSKNAILKLM